MQSVFLKSKTGRYKLIISPRVLAASFILTGPFPEQISIRKNPLDNILNLFFFNIDIIRIVAID